MIRIPGCAAVGQALQQVLKIWGDDGKRIRTWLLVIKLIYGFGSLKDWGMGDGFQYVYFNAGQA